MPSKPRPLDPSAVAFGARLRELRKARGWTQRELGERLGVTSQHVAQLERGRYQPSWQTAVKIAGVFGVGLDELSEGMS